MPDDFNLYPLHVFRLVARLGNVTRAARALFISQPAVSAHLKGLESYYGASLFERVPRGMLLTEAGRVVLEHANKLFSFYEEIPSAVSALRGKVGGEIMVAASSTPGAYLVPGLLRLFQERHPQSRPALMVGDSSEVLSWLHDYRVPFGVVGERVTDEGLYREKVGADELRLVTASADSLSRVRRVEGKHLRGHTLILREQGSSTRAGAEALLGGLQEAFGRVVEFSRTEAIKQCVAEGLGVAVLSSWTTKLEEQAGLLRPVRDKALRRERTFYVVRRRDRELTGTGLALWQCLTGGDKLS
jgi:DNA-binding transcriptional LysR family regulator